MALLLRADGYVVTCGHHERLPGEKPASHCCEMDVQQRPTVLGTDFLCDAGVLKITDDGPWPHVEMGQSVGCLPGTHCVLLGYPKTRRDQDTWSFKTKIIRPTLTLSRRDEWYNQFWTEGFPDSINGASGGGVFNSNGRLIGVLHGGAAQEMHHGRVELFLKNWNTLIANRTVQVVDASLLKEASTQLSRIEKEISAK